MTTHGILGYVEVSDSYVGMQVYKGVADREVFAAQLERHLRQSGVTALLAPETRKPEGLTE